MDDAYLDGKDETRMHFYIHEDSKNKKVRVHMGSCRHCKEGKGLPTSHAAGSRWHGPYGTVEEAQEVAKTIASKDTRFCGHCLTGRNF